MNQLEHATFKSLAESRKLLIGVDPAIARAFFCESRYATARSAIGDSILWNRRLVVAMMFLSPLFLFVSFGLAVRAFGWWSLLAIPFSLLIWFAQGGRASLGGAVVTPMLVLAIGAVLLFLGPVFQWSAALLLCKGCDQLKYAWAVRSFRALVVRNETAFNLLGPTCNLIET